MNQNLSKSIADRCIVLLLVTFVKGIANQNAFLSYACIQTEHASRYDFFGLANKSFNKKKESKIDDQHGNESITRHSPLLAMIEIMRLRLRKSIHESQRSYERRIKKNLITRSGWVVSLISIVQFGLSLGLLLLLRGRNPFILHQLDID